MDQSTGPKAESSRRIRRRSSSRSNTGRQTRRSTNNNPPEEGGEAEIFNPKELTSLQSSNENADPIDLETYSSIRMRSANVVPSDLNRNQNLEEIEKKDENESDDDPIIVGHKILHPHFEQLSLDDLFPNLDFSNRFFKDGKFREDIRQAMRKDIFYTTPAYSDLSPKVAAYMLDDDSSLQGSWNCIPSNKDKVQNISSDSDNVRMTRLTLVLQDYLGPSAPTGDKFMMEIGALCGTNPSTHWIDIIGVKDRAVSHSWHQDTGRSYENDNCCSDSVENLNNSRFTVMLGFPQEDEYVGTGVFSHAIKLSSESLAPRKHNTNQPVLFEGTADEKYIVRPAFSPGKEILRYRDIDTLHSAPDVVYRKSVMRFM